MIFAISTDDKTICVFASEAEAVAYCEGFDVSSGNWLFFNDRGIPMRAKFSTPSTQSGMIVTHGVYYLTSTGGRPLSQHLEGVAAVEGPEGLRSKDEIRSYLAKHQD
ncbi:hypothetical protein [Niveibacterium umoris]|uniref:Uncharacterized protein n=1 Tax=Niveibacterium umoris TaxID=1193620 RepID=A0A840BTW7_9RHOO|nr:hypothetical protein [Niveibacterium umoris]MBB4014948.1 hypothetical protein [Niveibacterium umoris]